MWLYFLGALFIVALGYRFLFNRGMSRKRLAAPAVRATVSMMDDESRLMVEKVRARYPSSLDWNTFAGLCIATAKSTKRRLNHLPELDQLPDYLDSLGTLSFHLLIEQLCGIEISEQEASKILRFEDLLRLVEAKTGSDKIVEAESAEIEASNMISIDDIMQLIAAKSNIDEDAWSEQRSSAYAEAGSMLRHYSVSRTAVISIALPVCLAIIGWAVSSPSAGRLPTFLLISEGVIFLYAVYMSLFFATKYEQARRCLVSIEAGEDMNVYGNIVASRLRGALHVDGFDKALISLGLIFHGLCYWSYFTGDLLTSTAPLN